MTRNQACSVVAVLAFAATLRTIDQDHITARSPDERVYTAQACVVLDHGVFGVRALAAEYIRDPRLNLYPLPTRVGYLGPLAMVMRVTGVRDVRAGRWLSFLPSVAAVAIVILIGWRFFGPWVGITAGLFLAVFTPDLVIARRTWSDSLVSCGGLLLIYCMLAIAAGPRRRGPQIMMVLVGSAYLLVKEIALVIYGLCLLWALGNVALHSRRLAVRFLAEAAIWGTISIAFWAWLMGGIGVLLKILGGVSAANAANQYALDYASGPAYLLPLSLWTMSPAVALLACAGLILLIYRRGAGLGLAYFTVSFGAIPMLLPHLLNLRYICVLFGPVCLLAAAGLAEMAQALQTWTSTFARRAVAVAASLAICGALVNDYRRFDRIWVRGNSLDLNVRMVLESNR